MEAWIQEKLSQCLDGVVDKKIMKTILAIKDDDEFDNYFSNLLSGDNEEHQLFLLNCRRLLLSGKHSRNTNWEKSINKPQSIKKLLTPSGTKKKNKYTNLYANDGKVITDTILLKGRRACQCQATQHKLINNCLHCGRIVCEQEGSGPCLFCHEPVYTPEEEQRMPKASSKQQKTTTSKSPKEQGKKQPHQKQQKKAPLPLQQQQQKQQPLEKQQQVGKQRRKSKSHGAEDEDLKKAIAQRDRLLEYDRNSEKRTTVIDDELDYFQENSVWLSDAEREKFERMKQEMHDMKHGSRIKRKIKVDFAGREIQDELPISKEYEESVLREIANIGKATNTNWSHALQYGHSDVPLAPNLNVAQPLYQPTGNKSIQQSQLPTEKLERIYRRVQDKELLEMQDMRQCLSMHQPWASLLMAGIKKHEGRVWYSEHRGRLWIASTTKEPRKEDIEDMEKFYRTFYNDPDLQFPDRYPTSCLLGCVHVENCLPQEEYRDYFKNGESDSPYVFICSRPEQLPVLIPAQGQHKIYELPVKTHNTACKIFLRAHSNTK